MPNQKLSTFGRDVNVPTWRIDTTAVINLGNVGDGVDARGVLQFTKGGSSFSAVIRKKVTGSAQADASAPVTQYTNEGTGATAATAITNDALVTVPASGCDLILDITMTSGTLVVEFKPID